MPTKKLDALDEKIESQIRKSLKLPEPRMANLNAVSQAARQIEKWTRKRDAAIRAAALEDGHALRRIAEHADMSHMSVSRVLHDVASPTTFGQRRSRANRQHVA